MGLEPIEKHILSVSCLPIPPQEHIVTVLRTAKRLVRLRGLEPRTCRLKVGLTPTRFASKFWWAMVGLNHQPSGYEPPALPVELMALMVPNRGLEPRTF